MYFLDFILKVRINFQIYGKGNIFFFYYFENLFSTKFWKKYSKYDYNEMKEIILEALRNEQINIGEKTPSKKNSNVFVQRCIQNKKIKIF